MATDRRNLSGAKAGFRNYPDAQTLHKGGPKAQYQPATDSWWMRPEFQDRAAFQARTKSMQMKPGMQIATNVPWRFDV